MGKSDEPSPSKPGASIAGLEPPEVLSLASHRAAVIHLVVPRSDLPKVMRPAITEVREVLSRQGIEISGPLFAHHLRLDDTVFDLEVGFTIDGAVQPDGRVRSGELPAARVIRATYRGPYEGLHAAWHELQLWADGQGHRRAKHIWEVYARGPEHSPSPADWRTDLHQPLS